jgi:branched-chain amino acid transport system ATP-binding protein
MTPTSVNPPVLVEARGINRRFGGLQALENVSVQVRKGRIRAVIGPNGAGKTTLFNIVSGVLMPDSGSILLDGHDITRSAPHRIAAMGVSRTFQNPSLFLNMTVLENVMIGRHIRSRCGLFAAALRLPGQIVEESRIRDYALRALEGVGLASEADCQAGALSYGQRRMVELARALATEPRLLLLDEPASGLNTREADDLGERIRRIRDSGVTILLVEHDMSLVMGVSDDVLVLHFGRTIADGSPADVRADGQVVSVYLGGEIAS